MLAGRGETVLELSRTPRAERRLRGKDDSLDAARAALAGETLALPRSGQRREALRLLLLARRSAVDVRREALGQLRGVIVTAPDQLREELRRLPTGRLLERCRRLRRSSSASADELATRLVLRSLAHRIEAATLEAAELEQEILAHVRALTPQLLDEPGVGPIVAAQLIVAWSHRGRVRSEAAFARLAGVAPVPASSGQTQRHRLSRGGDRQLKTELAGRILASKSGLTRVVDRMEEVGLVRRERPEGDRRVILIFITPEGLQALQAARVVHRRGIDEHFVRHLDERDLAALKRIFEKVRDHVRPLRPGRVSG